MPSIRRLHWLTSCNLRIACLCAAWPGCNLITWFNNTAVQEIATPKKKRSLLPLLTVLFILSYSLMTMLIVEQGAAIQSQSNLIKILLPDSRELWGLKGKTVGGNQTAKTQAPGGGANAPSTKVPPDRAQAAQPPSSQTGPQHSQGPAAKTAKPDRQFPPVPASDFLDQRRAVRTI